MKILEGTTQDYVMSVEHYCRERVHWVLVWDLKWERSIKSNQIESNQIESNQIKSNQIKSTRVKSKQIKQCQGENEHIRRDVNKSIQKRKERQFKEQTDWDTPQPRAFKLIMVTQPIQFNYYQHGGNSKIETDYEIWI